MRLHLLDSPELASTRVRFNGRGDNRVAASGAKGFRYDAAAQRVFVNMVQHFTPVSEALWSYRIGGYKVLEKWLKDRRERTLTAEEIRTYCRIATAVELTMEIQHRLDTLYVDIERQVLKISLEELVKARAARPKKTQKRN